MRISCTLLRDSSQFNFEGCNTVVVDSPLISYMISIIVYSKHITHELSILNLKISKTAIDTADNMALGYFVKFNITCKAESEVPCTTSGYILHMKFLYYEFHETCHSVTFIVLVNSHQR